MPALTRGNDIGTAVFQARGLRFRCQVLDTDAVLSIQRLRLRDHARIGINANHLTTPESETAR